VCERERERVSFFWDVTQRRLVISEK